jgi:hypothetical protein
MINHGMHSGNNRFSDIYAYAQEIINFFSTDKSTQELEKNLAKALCPDLYALAGYLCKTPTVLYVD